MLQRTCPFSCRNWAILGKKINLCESSLFTATRIQLRKCIFIDCRMEILAVGLLTDSVYGLHSYEGWIAISRTTFLISCPPPRQKRGAYNLLTNLALINNSLNWQSNPSWLKIIINLSKWLSSIFRFSFISSFWLNDVYVCGTVY